MAKGIKLVFTQEELDRIARLYDEGLSITKIAKLFGVSYTGMHNVMVRAGMGDKFRPQARIHTVNHAAFDCLENEHAAYWLGFIYADGHVTENVLQLGLSTKDKDHLLKLKTFLKTSNPVVERKYGKHHTARLYCASVYMVKQLKDLGIVKNRVDSDSIHKIPPTTLRHWIRGFFDGDGSADKNKSVWFCGREEMMAFLRGHFADLCGTNPQLNISKHSISDLYYLRYKGYYNAHKIADYMYEDATVWLERKKDRVDGWPVPMPRKERARLSHIARGFNVK